MAEEIKDMFKQTITSQDKTEAVIPGNRIGQGDGRGTPDIHGHREAAERGTVLQ